MVRTVDLLDLNDVSSLVPDVLDQFGRLDVLVNNAGMLEKSLLPDMPMGIIQRALAVHAIAPMILVRDAWAALSASARGVVINVSSISTLSPFPGLGAYGMSKHAIEGLTRSIHSEARDTGVGIVSLSIAPGAVDTAALQAALEGTGAPPEALVPMEEVTALVLACVRGEHDQSGGGVVYIPAPGVVTTDADEAMAALEACWRGAAAG